MSTRSGSILACKLRPLRWNGSEFLGLVCGSRDLRAAGSLLAPRQLPVLFSGAVDAIEISVSAKVAGANSRLARRRELSDRQEGFASTGGSG